MAEQQIIIKKSDDDHDHDHHNGGWKVAYADFMTAMMAFFLLLWIISAADEKQLQGLAEHFTPTEANNLRGGEGFLRGQVFGPDGVYSGLEGDSFQINPPSFGQEEPRSPTDEGAREGDPRVVVEYIVASSQDYMAEQDQLTPASHLAYDDENDPAWLALLADRTEKLDGVAEDISEAVEANAALVELDYDLRVDRTQDGLLVQILDQEGRPMFASGSARISDTTRELLRVIGLAVADLPYPIMITGHTDAVPFTNDVNYGNWELSADRANAARRALVSAGVAAERIVRVSGVAYTKPLNAAVPTAPENRRLTVLLSYPNPAVAGASPQGVAMNRADHFPQ